MILGCSTALYACSDTPQTGSPSSAPAVSRDLVKDKDSSLLRVAQVARDGGDYPAAIRLYRTLLQNGDKRPEVHLGLADCLFMTGAYAEAGMEYKAVEEATPASADGEIGLGRVFLAQQKPAEAIVEFNGALKHAPQDARALNGAGVALDNLGRHQEAQDYYHRGLDAAPDDRVLRNNYGLSLALSGNYAQAVTILKPLAEGAGATPRNRQNLALALGLSGASTEAEKIARVDLDASAVNNNMHFYEALRETNVASAPPPNLAGASAPTPPVSTQAAAAPDAAVVPAPSPVIASNPPPISSRPAIQIAEAAPTPAPSSAPPVARTTPVPLAPSSEAAPQPAEAQPIISEASSPGTSLISTQVASTAPSAPARVEPASAESQALPAVPVDDSAAAPLAPTPSAAPARPMAAKNHAGFGLQLAVYQKISGIAAGWQRFRANVTEIDAKLEPRVAMVDLGDGRGLLYRLKAGPFSSATAADAACQKLKTEGLDCKVTDFDGAPAQQYWTEHPIE
jgi:Flp pilus assembly protein TadD